MRKATQLWEMYRDNAAMQDIMETAVGAVVSAGGQALLTDMSAEEIALSTALGAGGAIAMRPVLGRIGYAVGRPIDKRMPGLNDSIAQDDFMASMSIGSPAHLKYVERLPEGGMKDTIRGISQAKYNQNFIAPGGRERGYAEGMLGTFGRQYGDNLAQGAVALATPLLLDSMGRETYDDQKVRQLKAELAQLEGQG
jgi:hypothetical protein